MADGARLGQVRADLAAQLRGLAADVEGATTPEAADEVTKRLYDVWADGTAYGLALELAMLLRGQG